MTKQPASKKLASGTRVAWSLTRTDAERFAKSPHNRKLIGEMVISQEKAGKDVPGEARGRTIYAIRVK